jgi:non-heme Fe2+,alpha-ketoglutarate-dependent halogenase
MLSPEQVERYRHDGYLFPLPALSSDEIAECQAGLDRFEHWLGMSVTKADRKWRSAGYVIMPWVDRLVRHPEILDAVESVIGSDILVYTSTFFIKEPHSPAFAAWHQDATYFGLTPYEHVTAWVALTDATSQAGCMEVVSSRGAPRQLRHAALGLADSINGGGQSIVEAFDQDGIVAMVLPAGSFSLHHTLCRHRSAPQPGVTPADWARHQLYPGACPHNRVRSDVGSARQRP